MPSRIDLERFRSSFRAIGGELSSLSARGEEYDELSLPEGGGTDSSSVGRAMPVPPPSAEDLFADVSAEPSAPIDFGAGATEGADAGGGGEDAFDFGAFLDSIPDDLSAPPPDAGMGLEPPREEEPLPAPEPPEAGFEPPFEASAFPGSLPESAAGEAPAGEAGAEDFGIPEGLLDGLAAEVEEGRAETPKANAEEFPADFSFDDLDLGGDFALGDDSASGGEEAPARDEEGAAEPSSAAGMPSEAEELEGEEIADEASAPEGTAAPSDFDLLDTDESFSLFSEVESEKPPAAEEKPTVGRKGNVPAAEDIFDIPDFSMDLDEQRPPAEGAPEAPEDAAGAEEDRGEAEGASIDSFDTFSLDNDFLSSGFGVAPEGAPARGEEDGFAHLEDFSLEGIDDVFRGAQAKEEPARVAPPRRAGRAMPSAEVEEIVLSEQDLEKLQATLTAYPLNLRIACEELIAEHAVPPEDMSALVRLLVRGAAARETATLASRLIGRSIPIPRGFEKRTGEELEAERATFAYAFVHNILPVLRVFAFVAAIATSVAYLGFEFVYRPLRAYAYYTQGMERIEAGEYARANERFDQGFRLRRSKNWFYKYARGFADERQYILAEEKYDQLLKLYPRDKRGALLYAAMESKELRNFAKADRILRDQILDYSVDDREGLLALGDNNMAWAEQDASRYEEARRAYARLMEKYGRQDAFLERMLIYFIRTDKLAEVLPLQEYFLSSEKRKISGPSLAELGGYLLDKKEEVPVGVPDPNVERIENLRKLLERAVRTDPAHPESYYHLARYYERYGRSDEERGALERALAAFSAAHEVSARRTAYRIDAHRRYATLLTQAKEFLAAQEQLANGIRLYEDALARRILDRAPEYGRLYADLGDLEYFKAGDLDAAMADYREAASHGWSPPEIRYRMGYVGYAKGDWAAAVEYFFDASTELPLNRRLMFALGNALYRRGDLHAAQGYYNRLLDMLEAERARFPVLVPNARPEHAELAERLMRARNNLGVTLEALADRTGDARYRARALALYSESARAWDALTRDPNTMVRSEQANLAFLNTRGSLYPKVPYEAQIYAEIDKDVQEPSVWEKILAE